MPFFSTLATVGTALLIVPSAVLATECFAACLPARSLQSTSRRTTRLAVLVPAHNEEASLGEALRSIKGDLCPGDRLIVVAHNCTDRTAAIARQFETEVIEVSDAGEGGKPDALKAGLRFLDANPPEIVVIVDADCRAEPGAVRSLAEAASALRGPVQGDYRFAARPENDFSTMSSLALLMKNVVRPQGLTRLGLPCLLNGAGSAYPFEQIRRMPHGEGSIAEDYQLAVDLARNGHRTSFIPEAGFRSVLPGRDDVALRQRRRWEHGHLDLLLHSAPRLIFQGMRSGNSALVFLGLDLLVPPLALLVLAWLMVLALAVIGELTSGDSNSLLFAAISGGLLFGFLLLALGRFAGFYASARALRNAPLYIAKKIPLYIQFLRDPEKRWQKTDRV